MISNSLYSSYSEAEIISMSPVSGGSINECFRIELADGDRLFLKRNLDSEEFRNMFTTEAKGLHLLERAGAHVPKVISAANEGGFQLLILEYIQPQEITLKAWERAGEMLAGVHRQKGELFGLDYDNFMGSLPQINSQSSDFFEFFALNRLLHQAKIARDSNCMDRTMAIGIEKLCAKLDTLIPNEPPGLVHGDLWSGNLLLSGTEAYLIDPAVAYSHREVDLAMTTLFGAFPSVFYESYQSTYPLEKGWQQRLDIFNLYPLLVHLNLFGEAYYNQVAAIVKKYSY